MVTRADFAAKMFVSLTDPDGVFGLMAERTANGVYLTVFDEPYLDEEMRIGFKNIGGSAMIGNRELKIGVEGLDDTLLAVLNNIKTDASVMLTNKHRIDEAKRLVKISGAAGNLNQDFNPWLSEDGKEKTPPI